MTLNFLMRSINLKIRMNDLKTSQSSDVRIFKNESSELAFTRFILQIEESISNTSFIAIDQIADYAKEIVNRQWFVDGNHRTALALCYYLSIFHNHQLPRIKSYLLYASIDFEYLKNIYFIPPGKPFFDSNAIKVALLSRSISFIKSEPLMMLHFEKILESILGLAKHLENLKLANSRPHTCGETQQIQLFKRFSGFRNGFCHSSETHIENYMAQMEKYHLLDDEFDPNFPLRTKI